jgi:hypothetical protein
MTSEKRKKDDISATNDDKRRRKFRWTTFLIHLASVSLLFLLPEVIVSLTIRPGYPLPPSTYAKAIVFAAAFYINFYWLVDSLLIKSYRAMRFILCNAVVILVGCGLLIIAWHTLGPGARHRHFRPENECEPIGIILTEPGSKPEPQYGEVHRVAMPPDSFAKDFIALFMTISLAVAIKLNFNRYKTERDRRELATLHKEIELKQLRSQLNPHFLFNTLNSIYALVDIDPGMAKTAVHRLSKMLRYTLSFSRQPVTIGQEFDFIKGYIELMEMRMPTKGLVKAHLDCSANPEAPIAPLIFINIIENAFKYGITASESTREINIDIRLVDSTVECHISNTYSREAVESLKARSSGIGIDNLRRRLELRYPNHHEFHTTDTGSEFLADLTIDLKNSSK